MQINRENLDKLLSMNDRQLKTVIQHLAVQSGINPADFNIDTNSIDSIRRALSTASDADLEQIARQYEENKNKKR